MSIDSKVQQALEQLTVSLGGATTGSKEGYIEQVEKEIAGGDTGGSFTQSDFLHFCLGSHWDVEGSYECDILDYVCMYIC
jgi:hypothetical protein